MKVSRIPIIAGLVAYLFVAASCNVTPLRQTPIVSVVRDCGPLVVNIRTETMVDLKNHPAWGEYGGQLDLFFKKYFAENYSEGTLTMKSVGSGVIINDRGYIVTNAHVVHKAGKIFAVLDDGTMLETEVVVVSREDDLAIIKTRLPRAVKNLKFADPADYMIGETVIAIGNPLGLENSVTVGVISGVNRNFSSTECEYVCSGLLQTDASINPGNSGGALLNLEGELVGLNLAIVPGAQNIGFAIPAAKILQILNELNNRSGLEDTDT